MTSFGPPLHFISKESDKIQNQIPCKGSFKIKLIIPTDCILSYVFPHCIFSFQHMVMQILKKKKQTTNHLLDETRHFWHSIVCATRQRQSMQVVQTLWMTAFLLYFQLSKVEISVGQEQKLTFLKLLFWSVHKLSEKNYIIDGINSFHYFYSTILLNESFNYRSTVPSPIQVVQSHPGADCMFLHHIVVIQVTLASLFCVWFLQFKGTKITWCL